MHLAADAVVLLFGPNLVRAHAFEYLVWSFDRAREHESNRLKQGDGARLEFAALAPHGSLADVAGDQVEPLDLRDRYAESLGDRRLHQALAQADAHLAGDDLDEEARRFGVHPPQHRFERHRLRVATSVANRFQCRFDVLQSYRSGPRAAFKGFAGPIAEVGVLAKDQAELLLVPSRNRGHNLAER